MSKSALPLRLALVLAEITMTAAGCGSQLTDGRYAGSDPQPVTPAPPSSLPAPTVSSVDPNTSGPQPITKTPITCDATGLNPAYLMAHYNDNLLPMQRLIIATAAPDANTTFNQIVIDNFVGSRNSLPANASGTVTLSSDNSAPSACGLCISATRNTDNVGSYKVISGALDMTTPANQGTAMLVTFHGVVLELKSGNTTTHWCIDGVTASTNTRSWTCADAGATNQAACWKSPDGLNAAALICAQPSNQPAVEGCQGLAQVCGSSVAASKSISSACNP